MKFKLLVLIVHAFRFGLSEEASPANCFIWGPGLVSKANLPVRYFYIQARDQSNNLITHDLGKDYFQIKVENPYGGIRVRVWKQLLNLHNGTYIARYRCYGYAGPLKVSVTLNEKHVADSPYLIENMSSDDCNCPERLEEWMNALQCPKSFPQIKIDLQPHKDIYLQGLRDRMVKRFPRHSFCHYIIKNNEIYRECFGQTTDFKIFVDEVLLSITKKTVLPDVELYWNLGDWPLEHKTKNPLPMISWCGSQSTSDIILPTYDLTGSVLNMMGRVSLDIFSVQANDAPKWENKKEVGFFRGRDSRKERLDLCEISLKYPDLVDSAITNYFFFKMDEQKYGKKVKHISFFDFFKNKYQLNIDGTVAAYRLPYLMLADSLVFKQNSHYYEHFYRQLKPNVHYIPIDSNLSNVVDKIKWAKENDAEARKVQSSGQKKVRELLTPVNIFCYHAILFKELAKRQHGNVTVLENMEKVAHKENKPNCNCEKHIRNIVKEEL